MNKLKIVQIISFIVLVVLLYFSTYIIVSIYNDVSNTNINRIEYFKLYEKDDVIYKIENIFVSNNLFKTITIQGYSFVENEFDNTNKMLYAYLISDRYCYKIASNITVHFQHYNLKKRGYKIYGNNIGFNIEFSGLNLNNGEYKLYIEDIENEKKYGITYAEYKIIVTDKNIKILKDEFYGINKIIDEFNTSTDFKFSHNIEKIDDVNCKILGWAYNTKEKEPVTIYVGLSDDDGNETYWTTEKYARPDVAKYYKDKHLLNTGYRTIVRMDNTNSCNLSSIIVRYENKYYKYLLNKEKKIYSKSIDISSASLKHSPIRFYIEKNKKEKNIFLIEGWGYLNDLNVPGKIYVGVKNKTGKEIYYTTEQKTRPDVVKYFNNAELLNSGFKANIELENNEEYFLSSILLEYNEKIYKNTIDANPVIKPE